MVKYFAVAVMSGILSALSQVLLKKSAERKKTSIWREYLNPYVIGGYAIMAVCMMLMIYAYRGVPFKYGAVLESLAYLYIMALSRIFLGERLTKKKIVGNIMIVVGVIIFSQGK